ncbi:MAG: hypothetical protein A2X64_06900 [Ignavibacteria bacterium GWF2_33_9]|nr:MAG: hypothetical protein A2X64_06900 [Ignavibacteria bacterium GWF2_33_9]
MEKTNQITKIPMEQLYFGDNLNIMKRLLKDYPDGFIDTEVGLFGTFSCFVFPDLFVNRMINEI